MKRSNIFILIGSLCIAAMFLQVVAFNNRYVTREAFDQNQQESVKYLDSTTYNYHTIRWEEPFHEIVIRDSNGTTPFVNKSIQWVKSEHSGAKELDHSGYGRTMEIRDGKLVIDYWADNNTATGKLIVYSPSLTAITVEGAAKVSLVETEVDSLYILAQRAELTIDRSSNVKALLDIRCSDLSTIIVQGDSLSRATYALSTSSAVKTQINFCGSASITGDSTSTFRIAPAIDPTQPTQPIITPVFASARRSFHLKSTYGTLALTEMQGHTIIENSVVGKIYGDRSRMTLHMTVPEIEATLAKVITK